MSRTGAVQGYASAAAACSKCQAPLVRSNARGARESMAFVLGGEVNRCLMCDTRFIRVHQRTLPGYTNPSEDASFKVAWRAMFSGMVMCMGIAVWTLHKFHRWPF